MTQATTVPGLTSALEDYLETVYQLVKSRHVARVRDIARARDVRSGSVTPAMKRLADLGLVRYVQREYIDLTPEGEKTARRIYARHQTLARFFEEVLGVPRDVALSDACAMEHSLSDQGMDHLVKLLEYLRNCPDGETFLQKYHRCPVVAGGQPHAPGSPCQCQRPEPSHCRKAHERLTLSELEPGQEATIAQVAGDGAVRQRLLDMGILPDVKVTLERVAPTGDPLWIRLQGFQLSLRRREADTVVVTP